MSKTTGPVLAIGGITMANALVFHDKPFDWRVPIATGITAMGFAFLEKVSEPAAVGLVWVALVAVLLTRIDPKVPAPVETLSAFMKKK